MGSKSRCQNHICLEKVSLESDNDAFDHSTSIDRKLHLLAFLVGLLRGLDYRDLLDECINVIGYQLRWRADI